MSTVPDPVTSPDGIVRVSSIPMRAVHGHVYYWTCQVIVAGEIMGEYQYPSSFSVPVTDYATWAADGAGRHSRKTAVYYARSRASNYLVSMARVELPDIARLIELFGDIGSWARGNGLDSTVANILLSRIPARNYEQCSKIVSFLESYPHEYPLS